VEAEPPAAPAPRARPLQVQPPQPGAPPPVEAPHQVRPAPAGASRRRRGLDGDHHRSHTGSWSSRGEHNRGAATTVCLRAPPCCGRCLSCVGLRGCADRDAGKVCSEGGGIYKLASPSDRTELLIRVRSRPGQVLNSAACAHASRARDTRGFACYPGRIGDSGVQGLVELIARCVAALRPGHMEWACRASRRHGSCGRLGIFSACLLRARNVGRMGERARISMPVTGTAWTHAIATVDRAAQQRRRNAARAVRFRGARPWKGGSGRAVLGASGARFPCFAFCLRLWWAAAASA
jgi:hypothetical protein